MMKLKQKVLNDLINVLDEEDGKGLMRHPKVMAAKLTIAKPMEKPEAEKEMPESEGEEPESEEEVVPDIMEDFDELPDEVKAQLLKLLSK